MVLEADTSKLLVLADGMGGHEGGALAAQAVVDTAYRCNRDGSIGAPADLLATIVIEAHERIVRIGEERGIAPHSTCVLLHLDECSANWAHVGDSRLYRFNRGCLIARTIDHSVVEIMRLQGRITEQEMKTHPDQNRLHEALGGGKLPEVEMGCAPLSGDDGFLLASDGLWENVDDEDLEEVFYAEDLGHALKALVVMAKGRGGTMCDNISVAVARHQPVEPTLAQRLRRPWRWLRV